MHIETFVGGNGQPFLFKELNPGDIVMFPAHDAGHEAKYLEYVLVVDRAYVEEPVVDSCVRRQIESSSGAFPVPYGDEQPPGLARRSVKLNREIRWIELSESLEHGKNIQGSPGEKRDLPGPGSDRGIEPHPHAVDKQAGCRIASPFFLKRAPDGPDVYRSCYPLEERLKRLERSAGDSCGLDEVVAGTGGNDP